MLDDADIANAELSPECMPKKGAPRPKRLALPPDFPELRLFALLKWKFGPPQGILTALGRPGGDPDGPIKWDYLFVPDGDLKLHIIRTPSGIDLSAWGTDVDMADVVRYLERNMSQHAADIDAAIETLECYTLILNPYVRHRNVVQLAFDQLDAIDAVEPEHPKSQGQDGELQAFMEKYTEYIKQVELQASWMLLLVTESAYMAEAYLNFIIALLVRPVIRTNPTIFQETRRRKWKEKISRLHLDCVYVKEPNMGDARIRDASTLFDIRNRVAHSYPDKEKMAIGRMWFENCHPILEKAGPFNKFVVAMNNQIPSITEARFCRKAASCLIDFLKDLIDPRVREQFVIGVDSNPIGYNETAKRYGIPFSFALFTMLGTPKVE
jgi:hypothetical protein